MTNAKTTPLTDADLDAMAGAGDRHDKWIPIESMSPPIFRATAQASVSGDYNGDGTVDGSDFLSTR